MRRVATCLTLWVASCAVAQPLQVTGVVTLPGLEAQLARAGDSVTVSYKKATPERRLLAVALRPTDLSGAKTVSLQTRLSGPAAGQARLALVAWSGDNAWFRTGSSPSDKLAAGGVSTAGLKPAAFSANAAAVLDWKAVDRLWLGVVIDGPAEGVWELSLPLASNQPVTAAAPLVVPLDSLWNLVADPAVKETHKVVNEGPDGKPALRFDLDYPEARHLFSMLGTPIKAEDYEGYRALRLTYKAALPKGPSLLFSLQEPGGGQYIIDPPPAQTDGFKTLEIPLKELKLGGWSKDENGHLDLEPGITVLLGCHGAPNPPGKGTLWFSEIALVP